MEQITLSPVEQRALNLLRNSPGEIQKIANNGNISIDALYSYFIDLAHQLRNAQVRRRKDYIDVDVRSV